MRRFLKKLLYLIVIVTVFYLLYLNPGNVVIEWYNYKAVTSVLAIALVIFCITVVRRIIAYVGRIIYVLFAKINLNDTLADYVKHIELSSQFDKEIQLKLIDEVKDLKTLKFFVRLNELVKKKQYSKANAIIRRKAYNLKIKNLLNYTNIQIILANQQIQEATEACKAYLLEKNKPTWAFLKLLDISLNYNGDLEQFKFLNNCLIRREVILDKASGAKVYCLINYQIAALEYKEDPHLSYKNLTNLIKKHPDFIPAYNLLIKYLIANNKHVEIKEYIVKSWHYDIAYENTILWSGYLQGEDLGVLQKEVQKLLKSSNKEGQNKKLLLQVLLYVLANNYLEAREVLLKVDNTKLSLYKLIKLYLTLKENHTKDSTNLITGFASGLKLNWWNEYLVL